MFPLLSTAAEWPKIPTMSNSQWLFTHLFGKLGVESQQSVPHTCAAVQQSPPFTLSPPFGWWTLPGGQQIGVVVAVTRRSGGQQTVGESDVIPPLPGRISLVHLSPGAQQVCLVAPGGPAEQHSTPVLQQSWVVSSQQNWPLGQQPGPQTRDEGHGEPQVAKPFWITQVEPAAQHAPPRRPSASTGLGSRQHVCPGWQQRKPPQQT
jgi:hypothetical protein